MTPKSRSSIFSRSSRETNGSGTNVAERLPVEPLEHRAAECCLAGPDVAGEHDQSFTAANREQQVFERAGVRGLLYRNFGSVERLNGFSRRP